MKKSKVSILAAAALALGGIAQAAPTGAVDKQSNTIVQKVNQSEQGRVRQSRELRLDGTGGIDFPFYDRGRSPKEYGQWLQANGLQKWSKRKK